MIGGAVAGEAGLTDRNVEGQNALRVPRTVRRVLNRDAARSSSTERQAVQKGVGAGAGALPIVIVPLTVIPPVEWRSSALNRPSMSPVTVRPPPT